MRFWIDNKQRWLRLLGLTFLVPASLWLLDGEVVRALAVILIGLSIGATTVDARKRWTSQVASYGLLLAALALFVVDWSRR